MIPSGRSTPAAARVHAPSDERDPLTISEVAACKPDGAELRRATRRLWGKAVLIGVMTFGSYLGLVFVADGPLLALPLGAVLVVALIATSTGVMHDANHGAFGKPRRVNQALAFTADVLGASSWFWRHKHNGIHHGNTNVVGIDTDIEQMPFARLAPAQPWSPWHRYQHVYIWPLYGLLAARMFVSDFAGLVTHRIGSQQMPRRPRRRDIAAIFAGKALHVGWAIALPLALHEWWVVLAFYFVCSWCVGVVLAIFFQLAHCNDVVGFAELSTPRRGDDFAGHQLSTTANVAASSVIGRLIAWLMGGLNHQIEHHLAPGVPHPAYESMAVRVRRLCNAHHIEYHVHRTFWTALCSHARWLRAMGRRPAV